MANRKTGLSAKKNDENVTGDFLDPTTDFDEIVGKDDNITGITENSHDTPETRNINYPTKEDVTHGLSEERYKTIASQADDPEEDQTQITSDVKTASESEELEIDELPEEATGNEVISEDSGPGATEVYGDQTVSGDMPDPASDDDVLENAHDMGYGLDENEDREHPKPLDMGSDFDKGEEAHRRGEEEDDT